MSLISETGYVYVDPVLPMSPGKKKNNTKFNQQTYRLNTVCMENNKYKLFKQINPSQVVYFYFLFSS